MNIESRIENGPLLGIDLGRRRTGLAKSDPDLRVATPLVIVEAAGNKLDFSILDHCRKNEVTGVVLGLPRHMDGREGDLAPRTRRLAAYIHRQLNIPVWLWDERLSTLEVDRRAREGGKRQQPRDDLAATLILQGFIDAQAWKRPPAHAGDDPGDRSEDDGTAE
ncbi:MAG: Holliday junction resolvase RuvX [Candidatus Eisenbacteria bacterium]|uniref:Putative pre-16S rRNA nuclease n=1 Tax=Eiseniibacteriota bacterium TaxID=2212470 RepID=A0A948RZP4_UNCEI|nr:Holliday junction resolvase RuvX [Candidatus Eisenbacteria bacterium]MBU1948434.1 Holliday junction resolvase RuvX [Candidatus Eisenbacteria bacterium]MBU2692911.1 Holliday junction resolvase RuvX [Candidatus Eisenbacteria bacterium]